MKRVTPVPVGALQSLGTAQFAALSSPKIRLSFYTPSGQFTATQGEDPATDLLAVSTQKSLSAGSQPGRWSATFTLRQGSDGETWASRINEQDGVVIEAKGDVHDPWTTVVVGWVDGIAIGEAPNGMNSQATVTISGSDMMKPLVRSQADFYAGIKSVPTSNQYATVTSTVQAYSTPSTSGAVVATLSPGAQAPVIQGTSAGWYQVALPAGDAWVPSSQVNVTEVTDPYMQTILQVLKEYGLASQVGGGGIGGLTGLLLNAASQKASAPFTSTADPPTLIAATLIVWLYKTFNVPWNLGRTIVGLPDIMRFMLQKQAFGISATSAALSPFQGAVWSFLTSFANAPLYELFCDTRSGAEIDGGHLVPLTDVAQSSDQYDASDGAVVPNGVLWGDDKAKAVLVYRLSPFDQDAWQNLALNTLQPGEIGRRALAKGDSDALNLFWCFPDIASTIDKAFASAVQPLLDAASAVRYGLRPLRFPVRGLALDANQSTTFDEINQALWRWYRENPNYWAGTIALQRGRPEIKVGQRVLDAVTGFSYYVEGVAHSFVVKGKMTTTLQLSRGAYRGGA